MNTKSLHASSKRTAILCAFAAAAGLLANTAAHASSETDWSSLSGSVDIPAGETWYADESDMEHVNALSSIAVAGVLVFRDTTTVPKAGLLSGAGEVRKSGSSVWSAYGNAQTSFTGDWHLDGGVVTNTAPGAFGEYDTSGQTGKLYVHDGAALVANGSALVYRYRQLRIEGAGNSAVPRAFAIKSIGSGAVKSLALDGDAAIETASSGNNWWLSNQGTPSTNAALDLGEYTLTQYGDSYEWYMLGVDVSGSGHIEFKGKGVVMRERTDWGGDGDGDEPFVFDGSASPTMLRFYNRPKLQRRDLRLDKSVSIEYGENNANLKKGLVSTNANNLAGDIVLNGQDVTLTAVPNYDNLQITLGGTVSGAGGLRAGDGTARNNGTLYLAGRNTYTGGTTVLGATPTGIIAQWPDSVPDWSATVVSNGYVAARLGGDGDLRWAKSDFWDVMTNIQRKTLGHFSIDATELDEPYELTVSEIAANVPAIDDRTIGAAGGTVRLVVDPGDEQRVGLAVDRGTLELSGGGTFRLAPTNSLRGSYKLANVDSIPLAEVRVAGGSTVVQGSETVHVGGTYYCDGIMISRSWARLVVTNASWITDFDTGYSEGGEPELGRGAIWVGHQNFGILEIQDGGVVSNKLVLGGGLDTSHGNGAGAVYLQSGGKLHIVRNGTYPYTSNIGSAYYGYVEQSGGIFEGGGPYIANYGSGLVHVYGGEGDFSSCIEVAACNSGQGTLYISNGTWRVSSYLRLCNGSENYAQVSVDGPGAALLLESENIYCAQGRTDYLARLDVANGGVLQFQRPHIYSNGTLDKATKTQPFVLNVDGGILRHVGSNQYMFGIDSTNRFSKIAIYSGGMTVDTNGRDVEQIEEASFDGATGGGIVAVDIGGDVENLVGAPRVVVENTGDGAGEGATAVADWDWKTRTLKGVLITSPGFGYTQGKVKVTLTVGNKYTWSKELTGDSVTVAANTPGGFTKRGDGVLTLNAANSWAQWTKVEGGTLKAAASGAIPSGTDVTLSGGGILDLGGFGTDIASVTYGPGGGEIANAGNATVPAAIGAELTVEDLIAGRSVAIPGAVDLSDVTIRITGDLSLLAAAQANKYVVVDAPDATGGQPALASGTVLPSGWVLSAGGGRVLLSRARGFCVIFR